MPQHFFRLLSSHYSPEILEAGCDEAGRGCLAGPVFAAAVILPRYYTHPLLNDSKKLSRNQRIALKKEIEQDAITWAVAWSDPETIDRMNILNASIHAMNLAIKKLNPPPQYLLIDGNRFHTELTIPYTCMIKGDGKYLSIAAASILAKTYRDAYMEKLHSLFPQYQWHQNKGYPTEAHRVAVAQFGATMHHRKSFRLDYQTKLEL